MPEYSETDFTKNESILNINTKNPSSDDDGIQVLGVVCLGWKDFWLNKQEYKGGYIFDLRVDKMTQRLGIGRNLMAEVETIGKKSGMEVLYFSVNGTALPAVNLYLKMNYHICSQRTLKIEVDLPDKIKSSVKNVKICLEMPETTSQSPKETIFQINSTYYSITSYTKDNSLSSIEQNLKDFHSKIDLAPITLEPILKKQDYLGTVIVRECTKQENYYTPKEDIIGLAYIIKKKPYWVNGIKKINF